jgi:hypothetical protein
MCRHYCNTRIGLEDIELVKIKPVAGESGRHAAWRLAGVISMPSTMVLIA